MRSQEQQAGHEAALLTWEPAEESRALLCRWQFWLWPRLRTLSIPVPNAGKPPPGVPWCEQRRGAESKAMQLGSPQQGLVWPLLLFGLAGLGFLPAPAAFWIKRRSACPYLRATSCFSLSPASIPHGQGESR